MGVRPRVVKASCGKLGGDQRVGVGALVQGAQRAVQLGQSWPVIARFSRLNCDVWHFCSPPEGHWATEEAACGHKVVLVHLEDQRVGLQVAGGGPAQLVPNAGQP